MRRSLLRDRVSVQTYLGGETAEGPAYSPPVPRVLVDADSTRRLVRTPTGDEAVSEVTLYVHPRDAATFTTESLVTFAGRTSQVLSVKPHTRRGRVQLVEVSCG